MYQDTLNGCNGVVRILTCCLFSGLTTALTLTVLVCLKLCQIFCFAYFHKIFVVFHITQLHCGVGGTLVKTELLS